MSFRAFIRRMIGTAFQEFIYDGVPHAGISELLEIMGSIINGFATPLKPEHIDFMTLCLIPLHKPPGLAAYHEQLSYCITQFVEKDRRLAANVIKGLLAYWPVVNANKVIIFLDEMEELLDLVHSIDMPGLVGPLFRRVAACISCQHFQVAERSLHYWTNDQIRHQTANFREIVFPLVVGPLADAAGGPVLSAARLHAEPEVNCTRVRACDGNSPSFWRPRASEMNESAAGCGQGNEQVRLHGSADCIWSSHWSEAVQEMAANAQVRPATRCKQSIATAQPAAAAIRHYLADGANYM